MNNNQHHTITDNEHDDIRDTPPPEAPRVINASQGCPNDATEFIDPIDENTGEAESDPLQAYAGEVLHDILEWVNEGRRPELIARRFRIIVLLLRPEMSAQKSMTSLALSEDCTKANICALANQFRDRFAFRAKGMRGEDARAAMSKAGGGNLGKKYRKAGNE